MSQVNLGAKLIAQPSKLWIFLLGSSFVVVICMLLLGLYGRWGIYHPTLLPDQIIIFEYNVSPGAFELWLLLTLSLIVVSHEFYNLRRFIIDDNSLIVTRYFGGTVLKKLPLSSIKSVSNFGPPRSFDISSFFRQKCYVLSTHQGKSIRIPRHYVGAAGLMARLGNS